MESYLLTDLLLGPYSKPCHIGFFFKNLISPNNIKSYKEGKELDLKEEKKK